jgi:hypothetical protein
MALSLNNEQNLLHFIKKIISGETMQFFQIVFSLFVIAVTNNLENIWKKNFFQYNFGKVCYFRN